jgi:hypothetical protein
VVNPRQRVVNITSSGADHHAWARFPGFRDDGLLQVDDDDEVN